MLVIRIPRDADYGTGTTCSALIRGGWSDEADECFYGRGLLQGFVVEAVILAVVAGVLIVKRPTRRRGRVIASVPLILISLLASLTGLGVLIAHEYVDRWLGLIDMSIAAAAACAMTVVWGSRQRASPGEGVTASVNRRVVIAIPALWLAVAVAAFVVGQITEAANLVSDAGGAEPSDCLGPVEGLDQVGTNGDQPYGVSYSRVGGGPKVELSNPDGAEPRYVGTGANFYGARWSQDGRRAVVSDGEMTLIELAAIGSARTQPLGRGEFASLDPTGTHIAFIRDGHLFAREVGGNDTVELGRSDDRDPAVWSRDGLRLAVSDGTDVYVIGRDGSDKHVLPRVRGGFASSPSWSPTEDLVAYIDGEGVGIARSDGSGRRVIVVGNEMAFAQEPEWSPDGRHVSFVWTGLGDPRGFVSTICIASIDGGPPWRVPVTTSLETHAPLWSPDGRLLLASPLLLRRNLRSDLISVEVMTGATHLIAQDATDGTWVPL
jgi:hypothetical protein